MVMAPPPVAVQAPARPFAGGPVRGLGATRRPRVVDRRCSVRQVVVQKPPKVTLSGLLTTGSGRFGGARGGGMPAGPDPPPWPFAA